MQINFQTASNTGGSRGLRRQIAVKFAREGAKRIAIIQDVAVGVEPIRALMQKAEDTPVPAPASIPTGFTAAAE